MGRRKTVENKRSAKAGGRGMNKNKELNTVFDDNFLKKCKTCQHCYTKQNDDETVYCRKRSGICKYKEYSPNNKKVKK